MVFSYGDDLEFDVVLPSLKERQLSGVLRHCAGLASGVLAVPSALLLDGLCEERRLDRVCVGGGVALSDLKVRGLSRPFLLLARFSCDTEFDTLDGVPVRLFSLILSPHDDGVLHLRRLSRVSRLLKDEALYGKLLGGENEEALRSVLMNPEGWLMAA